MLLWYILGPLALLLALRGLRLRLVLSRAKHRSLAGHSRMARLLARLVRSTNTTRRGSSASMVRPREVAADAPRRICAACGSCTRSASTRVPRSDREVAARGLGPAVHGALPRALPVQPARCDSHLPGGSFLESSCGRTVTDLDGNRLFDLTGSYGVNVFGYDFYKECIERGSEQVRALGPVLGAYHPVTAYNVRRLREISGLDEVSFHMSGTEAVMQAVRLARYHTRRRYLVRFCGAYHGWWGDVQPGVGNPSAGARHLHAEGYGCGDAARAAHAAATSPACWSIRCRRCIPTRARRPIRR